MQSLAEELLELASQVPGSISDRETSSKKTRLRVGEKTREAVLQDPELAASPDAD